MKEVSRLLITIGLNENGQPVSHTHFSTDSKKLFVLPGKYAEIRHTDPDGKVRIAEIPIGALGWEYDPIS